MSKIYSWASPGTSKAKPISPGKEVNRVNNTWVVMKGAPSIGTRSLADGAYDLSTWGVPGTFTKVHAGSGLYFATDAGTELVLKQKANVSGRVMQKGFTTAGIIPHMKALGHVTLQRSYPGEAHALMAMDMIENLYKQRWRRISSC